MRSTPSRANPSPYKAVRYSPRTSLVSRSRTSAFTTAAQPEEPAATDAAGAAPDAPAAPDAAAASSVGATPTATAAGSPPPAAVLVSNLPAAACNGLYVLEGPADASESPHFANGEGQHLYTVKDFEHRAVVRKWVISSSYSPGGSSIGRRAVVTWADGELPPMGEQKWLIIADSSVSRSAADESKLLAPVTLTAIPASSVAALNSLEGAAQRARSQQREAEVELAAVKRELQAKEADAAKAEAERVRLDEKAQRNQADMERMNARFEGLIQDKVAEIGRLGANIKEIKQQNMNSQQRNIDRAESGYGEVVDVLRSLGESQVHCGSAVSVLSEYIEESCRLGSQPEPGSETPTESQANAELAVKVPLWDDKLWRRLAIQPPAASTGKAADDFAKGMQVLMEAAGAGLTPAQDKLVLDQLPCNTQSLSGLEKFLVVKEALKHTFVLSRHSREQSSLAQFYCTGKHAEPQLAAFYGKDETEHGSADVAGQPTHVPSASWHCVVDGAEVSEEYELQELCDLYLTGAVTDDTKCWTEGMREWATIGSLGAFSAVREQRSGVTAISLAIDGFMRQLDAGVQPYLRECGGMRAIDESISHIIEQCVQRPMHACLALKNEQEQAAAASAMLRERQRVCEAELAQLTSMLESGTSRVSKAIESIDTVYDAVSLADLGQASVALAAKEAELHEIMQERLVLNASLRDLSGRLLVGESAEQRVQTLHAMVVDDVASFATKQTKCTDARNTITSEIEDIMAEREESEATVTTLRAAEVEAREVRLSETAVFVERLRELVAAELASEAEFRGLVERTDSQVAEEHERQASLVEPQRQLERAQREMGRYEQAYGAAASGLREVEGVTSVLLGKTDCVMEQHMRRASAWHRAMLTDHVEIWQGQYQLLQKQLKHEQGRQAELLEEEAQLERQTVRALRAGNKLKINDLQERKKELSVEITQAVDRLAELGARVNAMFTPEIDETSAKLNQQHPATASEDGTAGEAGTRSAGTGSASATAQAAPSVPPPLLPPPGSEQPGDDSAADEEEEPELEIFVVLVGGKEPHGPLTVSETGTLLANGSVTPGSLSWCEGMEGWAALRASEIIAPLLNLQQQEKKRPHALPPALPSLRVLLSPTTTADENGQQPMAAAAAARSPMASPRSKGKVMRDQANGSPRVKGLMERTNSSTC